MVPPSSSGLGLDSCDAAASAARQHTTSTAAASRHCAKPRGVVDEQTCGLEVGGAPRDLKLNTLKLRDRAAELLTLLRVRDAVVERPAREPDHLGANANAPLVERLDRDLVALTDLAED